MFATSYVPPVFDADLTDPFSALNTSETACEHDFDRVFHADRFGSSHGSVVEPSEPNRGCATRNFRGAESTTGTGRIAWGALSPPESPDPATVGHNGWQGTALKSSCETGKVLPPDVASGNISIGLPQQSCGDEQHKFVGGNDILDSEHVGVLQEIPPLPAPAKRCADADTATTSEAALPTRPPAYNRSASSGSLGANESHHSIGSGSAGTAARKTCTTQVYGGKVALFSTVVDTTPQRHVRMDELCARGPRAASSTRQHQQQSSRPASDFRQSEAWQKAYALRQRSRQPSQKRDQDERPGLRSSSKLRGQRGQRHQQSVGREAAKPTAVDRRGEVAREGYAETVLQSCALARKASRVGLFEQSSSSAADAASAAAASAADPSSSAADTASVLEQQSADARAACALDLPVAPPLPACSVGTEIESSSTACAPNPENVMARTSVQESSVPARSPDVVIGASGSSAASNTPASSAWPATYDAFFTDLGPAGRSGVCSGTVGKSLPEESPLHSSSEIHVLNQAPTYRTSQAGTMDGNGSESSPLDNGEHHVRFVANELTNGGAEQFGPSPSASLDGFSGLPMVAHRGSNGSNAFAVPTEASEERQSLPHACPSGFAPGFAHTSSSAFCTTSAVGQGGRSSHGNHAQRPNGALPVGSSVQTVESSQDTCSSRSWNFGERQTCSQPPQPNEVPLREMQRLLGETWRCRLSRDGATSGDPRCDAGSLSAAASAAPRDGLTSLSTRCVAQTQQYPPPIEFSHETNRRQPPPICSDLLEVRAQVESSYCASQHLPYRGQGGGLQMQSGSGSTAYPHEERCHLSCSESAYPDSGRSSSSSSNNYVFLGRLVTTLPGDDVASRPQSFISSPQAVVECNFWQLRSAAASRVGSLPPSSCLAPIATAPPPAQKPRGCCEQYRVSPPVDGRLDVGHDDSRCSYPDSLSGSPAGSPAGSPGPPSPVGYCNGYRGGYPDSPQLPDSVIFGRAGPGSNTKAPARLSTAGSVRQFEASSADSRSHTVQASRLDQSFWGVACEDDEDLPPWPHEM